MIERWMARCDGRCKKLAFLMGAGIVVLALLGWRVLNHLGRTSPDVAAAAGLPLPVAVQMVGSAPTEQILGAEAVAKESQLLPIRTSQMTATVAKSNVKLGDIVKRGEVLYQLEGGLQGVTLRSARSELAIEQQDAVAAKQRLLAVKELYNAGLASSDEFKTVSKDYSDISKRVYNAEVKVQAAAENQRAILSIAPVTGVVTEGELHSGMVVRAGVDLFKLSVIDPIHVTIKLAEDKVKYAQIGQIAEVSFYAFPGRTFQGKVALINPTVEDKTRLASVIVRVDNPKLELMPGMNGVATIKSQHENLRIPSVALISSKEGSPYVFIVDQENRAHLRRVGVRAQAGGFAEIESGLDGGEQVVVVGQTSLSDNQQVRVGTEYAERK
ncbi:MAG: efflux RND transporter periplasmic adaptor subunit [Gallionellaceae bacterium]|nr:efflux RND transporter periplasmic adaptor subunit [Gallionellaceae bacterium]